MCLLEYPRAIQNRKIIHYIDIKKQHKTTKYDINVHMKQNDIRNIALKIGRDISSEDYGKISTSDKNSESGYYLHTVCLFL